MRAPFKKILLAFSLFVTGYFFAHAQPVFDPQTQQRSNADFVSIFADGDVVVEDLGSFSVNTLNRDETRSFFNAIYMLSEDIDMEWTGDYFNLSDTVAAAGDISETYRLATLLRVNYFRAMAGLPADIVFHSDLNADSQLAAIIMSGNNSLSHFPETDGFPNYITTTGHETAGKSNIAIGSSGPDAIVGYMRDKGASNYKVGHRRWILYPPAYKMGSGDTPKGSAPESILSAIETFTGSRPNNDQLREANSLVVITDFNSTRPITAWPFVSYPAPGYAPYQIVYPRWSFSIEDADFSNATVEMTRDGSPINVELEPLASFIGDNTLAWVYDNQDSESSTSHEKPDSDIEYEVTISNIANAPSSTYTYTVTVFDPSTPGDDYVPTAILGSAEPLLNIGNDYSIQESGDWVPEYQWRSFEPVDVTETWDAENGDQDVTPVKSEGYAITQSEVVSEGSSSYHFIQIDFENQYLIIDTEFVADANSSLTYDSLLRAMTDEQYAEVQISLDGGISWETIDSQQGLGPSGEDGGASTPVFSERSIDLSSYTGKTFHLRFGLVLKGNNAFIGTNPHSLEGWFFDDITFTNVDKATNVVGHDASANASFSFTPTTTNPIALQAQGVIFDEYGLERGPIFIVSAINGSNNAPDAVDDTASIDEGTTTTSGNVLDNDTDSDPDTVLNVNAVNGEASNTGEVIATDYGTIRIQPDGNFVYSLDLSNLTVEALNDGELLTETIEYTISDGHETDSANLTININGLTDVVPVAELINISTRGNVQTGDSIMIGGFVIEGTEDLELLIQGVGAELSNNLSPELLLANPYIAVFNSQNEMVAENDNWDADNALLKAQTMTRLGATQLQVGSQSAALVDTFAPGIYTVFLYGVESTEGIALIEIYNASDRSQVDSELINISTRGDVGNETDVMIGGFVIDGNTSKNVLIQGVAEELSGIDSANLLSDAVIFLVDSKGDVIASNDDWESADKEAKAQAGANLGATPLVEGSKSASLYLELDPGVYTVILGGIENATGIALIEAYITP